MMKQLKSLLIATVLFFGVNQAVKAQTKTAHVNVSEIMAKMPAMLEAQKQLEKLNAAYDTDYKTMMGEFQSKLKKYESEDATVGEKVREERTKELQELYKRIEDYKVNAQKDLQQKQEEITKPIYEKIKTSIQKVGKAKGYQYVLDSVSLILADGPEITNDVKKDLGF